MKQFAASEEITNALITISTYGEDQDTAILAISDKYVDKTVFIWADVTELKALGTMLINFADSHLESK